ncbi:conjugal transfer protein TraX, partial [Proteus mirabilis]|nr:conjugal transfer protein TraX [Proteus mirabilis]
LFCFVLAYNLARPDSYTYSVYSKVCQRLMIFGLLATPAYIMLGGVIDGWWPLNILFTLQAVTIICYLIELGERRHLLFALLVFAGYGAIVEFWWPAVAMGVCIWLYYKKGRGVFILLAFVSCVLLTVINHNFYALLATPLIAIIGNIRIKLPRLKWFFYVFYPAHLYLILALQLYLATKGYLFFT